MDPNTDIPKEEIIETEQQKLAQAAIPAALITLYKYIPKTVLTQKKIGENFQQDGKILFPLRSGMTLHKKFLLMQVQMKIPQQIHYSVQPMKHCVL